MSKKVLATMLAATMLMGATASTVSAAGFTAPEGVDPSEYHLAICIHSMDNEYWAQEAKGAQLAAEYYGVGADILTCDSDDNKQIQGIKDYIAQYGDKAIFVVDPSSTANTVNIAETCEDAGVYVLVGVISFATAVMITVLCIRLREREHRGQGTGKGNASQQWEEKIHEKAKNSVLCGAALQFHGIFSGLHAGIGSRNRTSDESPDIHRGSGIPGKRIGK